MYVIKPLLGTKAIANNFDSKTVAYLYLTKYFLKADLKKPQVIKLP
jgi:hypothetical protein